MRGRWVISNPVTYMIDARDRIDIDAFDVAVKPRGKPYNCKFGEYVVQHINQWLCDWMISCKGREPRDDNYDKMRGGKIVKQPTAR